MPERAAYSKPLTLAFVRSVTAPGRYHDKNGLILTVSPGGAKSWMKRLTINGHRHDIGLGSAFLVTPSQAWKAAARQKALVRKGGDLLRGIPAPRRSEVGRTPMRLSRFLTHRYADIYADSSPRRVRANYNSIRRHTVKTIGKLRLDEIESAQIEEILRGIAVESADLARWMRLNLIRVFDVAL